MKKILFIVLPILFVSCNNSGNEIKKVKEYKPTITYKYEKCKLCNGTGKVAQSVGEKTGLAVLTMGISLLSDEYVDCPQCEGKGYVKVADKIK